MANDNLNVILSRSEEILASILENTDYTGPRISRIEKLLYALKGWLAGKADLDSDGLIPVNELPPVVFEHMKVVDTDTERFELTTDDVQNGDTVYVNVTQIMYFVVDDTKLDREAGYKPLAAGTAARAVADKNGNDIAETYQPKIDSTHKISADNVDDSIAINKFVTAADKTAWNGKQDALTFDVTPTDSSTNPVTSGGVYTALAGKQDTIDSTHKISADNVDDSNATNKFVTAAEKTSIGTSETKLTGVSSTTSTCITLTGGGVLYLSPTEPTGTIPDGAIWIDTSTT